MTNTEAVSLSTRIEVTKKLKHGYKTATKTEKGQILDHFCQTTGLSRSSARRYLTSNTVGNPKVIRIDKRKTKPRKYSLTTQKFLLRGLFIRGSAGSRLLPPSRLVRYCSQGDSRQPPSQQLRCVLASPTLMNKPLRLWKLEAMPCSKHMAVSMSTWLNTFE